MKTGKLNINWMGGMGGALSSTIATGDNTYSVGFFNPFLSASYDTKKTIGMASYAFGANTKYINTALSVNIARTSGGYAAINIYGGIDVWSTLGTFSYLSPIGGIDTSYIKDIWTHLFYNAGSPTEALLFTYTATGTGYLGVRYGSGLTSSNYTLFTFTYGTANIPHVGCVSVSNKSYITDGNFVRAYDPNTGTFNSINIGIGYTTKSVADYGSYVAIVGDDGKQARMWLWDGSAANANFQYEIRDETATAVINHGGILKVFSQGRNGTFKLRSFDGISFKQLPNFEVNANVYSELGVIARYSNSPKHNQVTIWQNMVTWVTDTAYVWTYGSPKQDEFPEGLHNIGYLSDSTLTVDINATSYGSCLKNLSGAELWGSFIATNGNSYIGVTNSGSAISTLNPSWGFTTKSYELPHKATIKCIHVYFFNSDYSSNSNTNTGISVYIYRRLSASTGSQILDEELLGTTSGGIQIPPTPTTRQSLTYYPYKKSLPNMDLFYLKLVVTAPLPGAAVTAIIRKIVVEYNYDEGDI